MTSHRRPGSGSRRMAFHVRHSAFSLRPPPSHQGPAAGDELESAFSPGPSLVVGEVQAAFAELAVEGRAAAVGVDAEEDPVPTMDAHAAVGADPEPLESGSSGGGVQGSPSRPGLPAFVAILEPASGEALAVFRHLEATPAACAGFIVAEGGDAALHATLDGGEALLAQVGAVELPVSLHEVQRTEVRVPASAEVGGREGGDGDEQDRAEEAGKRAGRDGTHGRFLSVDATGARLDPRSRCSYTLSDEGKRAMNVLGISAFYHDAAACLVQDGRVVAAAQEERFTRIKQDPDFPARSVAYCLREGGIRAADLDWVVFYDKPWRKFERLLETWFATAPRGWRGFLAAMPVWLKQKFWLRRTLREALEGYDGAILFTEHHEAHAASAFFPSPFEEAAILTVDGVGEWATASQGAGHGNRIEIHREMHFPHSPGMLYSAFTYYTGFRVNSGEYKVMGLAPYGQPRFVEAIYEHLVDLKADGSFRLNVELLGYLDGMRHDQRAFRRDLSAVLLGRPKRPCASATWTWPPRCRSSSRRSCSARRATFTRPREPGISASPAAAP